MNVAISDKRRDLGGETQCPARERDGTRCEAEAGMWSFAHLCNRHHNLIARGVKVVLVDGMRLDHIWRAGKPYRGPHLERTSTSGEES